uniref:Exosortase/archaeosortase family protein n=1 Tax=Haemonchus placei TaxID=6290 RepID=A0A0N4WU38_HAEPC
LVAMMMVVDATGLALIPWDRLSDLIVVGVTWFFKFFIFGVNNFENLPCLVGGSIPYVFQYAEIHHRRNAQGFSLFVCLALCIANILRILFWFGKRFDLALLAQSIVMFICMIFMLEIAVRMNKKHTPKSQQKSLLSKVFFLLIS